MPGWVQHTLIYTVYIYWLGRLVLEDRSDPSLLSLLADKEAECFFSVWLHFILYIFYIEKNCIIIFLQISSCFLKWCICSSGDRKIKKQIRTWMFFVCLCYFITWCALLWGENLVSPVNEILTKLVFSSGTHKVKSVILIVMQPKSYITKLPLSVLQSIQNTTPTALHTAPVVSSKCP